MTARRISWISVLAVALMACAGGQKNEQTSAPTAEIIPPGPTAAPEQEQAACPFAIPGVEIAIEDVDGGIAISFTGSEDQVQALRDAGRRVAERHTYMSEHGRSGRAPMHGGDAKKGMGHMPGAEITAEDIAGGVRLSLQATNEAEVEALREHVRRHAEMMRRGECPRMQMREEGGEPGR